MKTPPWTRRGISMSQRLADFTVALVVAGWVLFVLGLAVLYLLLKFFGQVVARDHARQVRCARRFGIGQTTSIPHRRQGTARRLCRWCVPDRYKPRGSTFSRVWQGPGNRAFAHAGLRFKQHCSATD